MRTRAAVLYEMGLPTPYRESKPLVIEELDLEPPGPGEVLVRIRAAGLCHSDLSVINGNRPRPTPMALGHEAAGEVVEVGEGVRDLAVGDHVVWSAGTRVRGHEFHYSEVEPGAVPAWTLEARGAQRPEGHVSGAVHASFLHTHWAATPHIAARLVAAALAGVPRAPAGCVGAMGANVFQHPAPTYGYAGGRHRDGWGADAPGTRVASAVPTGAGRAAAGAP